MPKQRAEIAVAMRHAIDDTKAIAEKLAELDAAIATSPFPMTWVTTMSYLIERYTSDLIRRSTVGLELVIQAYENVLVERTKEGHFTPYYYAAFQEVTKALGLQDAPPVARARDFYLNVVTDDYENEVFHLTVPALATNRLILPWDGSGQTVSVHEAVARMCHGMGEALVAQVESFHLARQHTVRGSARGPRNVSKAEVENLRQQGRGNFLQGYFNVLRYGIASPSVRLEHLTEFGYNLIGAQALRDLFQDL